jgi:hypothetical protein
MTGSKAAQGKLPRTYSSLLMCFTLVCSKGEE